MNYYSAKFVIDNSIYGLRPWKIVSTGTLNFGWLWFGVFLKLVKKS